MKQVEVRTDYPDYCDFSCPHAEFSDPCAVGACRRDIGVWCRKAARYNNKHARCLIKAETGWLVGSGDKKK